ncbi:MAGUK p55 subfamily member 7 isoform X4 [Halyomorpha halys]|uniref:MAGUK p55 subfamily member 7 isoform X4 n=1 Tax=Halyomorpha halys TaxID=286706 RepID=UPI0006D527C3|nr:MAGUK p55 subfamily member 7 isoform X4 [Halyomorpha halys]
MTAVMANGNWDPSLSGLLASLEESRRQLPSSEEEFGFLSGLLQSKELHALVKVHNKILENGKDDKLNPVLSSSMQVAVEVLEVILPRLGRSEMCKELFILLQKPHLQGLMCAHDAVAQKDYFPRLPEIPLDVEEDEETIKIVQLVKSNEPLTGAQSAEPIVGATIKSEDDTGKIVIARVMHGGAADRSGLIHVGDEVVEVNGINVEGKTPNDVLAILQASEGTITFKLVPADGRSGCRESKVRVRAHFDYCASADPYIPCKEAGLDFLKGDILHIVSQDDAYWWQARKEGDRNMRAGLIPSRALQERRILHERQQEDKTDSEGTNLEADDFMREEVATYEEVAKLYPRPGLYRPLALVGPPGVGRNELKRRLISTDPSKYRSPVPFTTRSIRPGEIEGKDYYFVSREVMEEDVAAGKFIEYGEYKGNLYGTSVESVLSLINAGYVCILSPHYQALKMIRTAQIKPYIIYIKPPLFDTLKETRTAAYARSTFDKENSRGFTDDELREMIHRGRRIEFMFSHFFDEEIINADLSSAFESLVRIAISVETEPQWVPASWVQ